MRPDLEDDAVHTLIIGAPGTGDQPGTVFSWGIHTLTWTYSGDDAAGAHLGQVLPQHVGVIR